MTYHRSPTEPSYAYPSCQPFEGEVHQSDGRPVCAIERTRWAGAMAMVDRIAYFSDRQAGESALEALVALDPQAQFRVVKAQGGKYPPGK